MPRLLSSSLVFPSLLGLALVAVPAAASEIDTVAVVGLRLPVETTGIAATRFSAAEIEEMPALRLDDLLRSVPGVGLFRPAGSITAHPTTQGLNMRGVGANGAGRVLVMLDGVPLSDPFGGWVNWSAIDTADLQSVSVMAGGTPGVFGAQALSGAVLMESRRPETSGGRVAASYGSFDTRDIAGRLDLAGERASLTLTGGHLATDGFYIVDADRRGEADKRARHSADHASLRASADVGPATTLDFALRYEAEDRLNGLAGATNRTEGWAGSLRLVHGLAEGRAIEAMVYAQRKDFENVFVAVLDEARDLSRPVLDQHDVPARGYGALMRYRMPGLEIGADARLMEGTVNEYFRNLGGGFTRERTAGGEQSILGLYGEATHVADKLTVSATARLDRWRTHDGERVERDLATGDPVLALDVPDKDGWVWTGRIGASYAATDAIEMKASAYRTWRLPTINEYYRPFRVGNDITEANANLTPETLYGIEAGLTWRPLATVRGEVTLFRTWLHDGVGNVTIGVGPGTFPVAGFIPEGGTLRQRTNIDRSVTDGVAISGEMTLDTNLFLYGAYQYARARVTAAAASPDIVGKPQPLTPRHTLTGRAVWREDDVRLTFEGRYASGQYDDDLATRRLKSTLLFNAGAAWQASAAVTLRLDAENLFDARVVSALSADGEETLAARRLVRAGVELRF